MIYLAIEDESGQIFHSRQIENGIIGVLRGQNVLGEAAATDQLLYNGNSTGFVSLVDKNKVILRMVAMSIAAIGLVVPVGVGAEVEVGFVVREEVELDVDGVPVVTSSDGFYQIVWREVEEGEMEVGRVFQLEQSGSAAFSGEDTYVRYEGRDRASFLTGFAEGGYWFRVRAMGGQWSEPLRLEVEYMDRWVLLLLVLAGLLVVAMTVIALLRGHFRYRDDDGAGEAGFRTSFKTGGVK